MRIACSRAIEPVVLMGCSRAIESELSALAVMRSQLFLSKAR